jgi:hypothetical protein
MSEPESEVESAEGPRLFPYLPTEPIEGDHIYVSTFALGWRKLRDLAGGDVRVEGAPQWLDAVAGSRISEADVPPNTLVTVAGFGPPAVEEVRREMKATFGAEAGPMPALPALDPEGLLLFARLKVAMDFAEPFVLEKKDGLLFDGVRVKQFGCQPAGDRWWDIAKQVVVHRYEGREDFVVELLAKESITRLIVARMPGKTALAARVAQALAHAGSRRPVEPIGAQCLMRQDVFCMPLIRVKETRAYDELIGRTLRGVSGYGVVDVATQDVELLVDERGVQLLSTYLLATRGMPPRGPYCILVDGPFLVVVIRDGSNEPLAAAAIETPRWLVPIDRPDEVRAGSWQEEVIDAARMPFDWV